MRNIAMVPGLLALLLTGVLFYVVYHKPQPVADVSAKTSGGAQAGNNFRLAYFNLDSLESHYQYFKDVLDQVKGKESEMNAELSGMEKGFQKKISEWQKEAQQEYAQMQQNYQLRKQTLQEALMKHNEDLKADIRKKIEDYLKEYNKEKKYNYIISYEANSFIYIRDTANNITDDLVSGLNASYKKK
jgi:outer membrane protein